jgi:hypothetical protein
MIASVDSGAHYLEDLAMSISSLFKRLGAPLANNRWSWGAHRPSDGAVFLRVWQDLKFIDEGGRIHMLVANHSEGDGTTNLGADERVRQIERIRAGASCFMVMCVAHDVDVEARTIQDFDESDIFVGGNIVETPADFRFPRQTSARTKFLAKDGATWIPVEERKSVDSLIHVGT